MDTKTGHGLNNRHRIDVRNISLSRIEKKIGLPNFLSGDIQNVQAGDFEIFRRDPESILKSTLFGVQVLWIAVIGTALWLLKRK